MIRRALLVAAMMLLAPAAPGVAAELDGVVMPELRQAAGTTLRLNGMGARLYSVFRVTVYVAGLYLERPSGSADAILRSPEVKLIEVRSLHSAGQDDVRAAWRYAFEANCRPPCVPPAQDIAHFLATSPAVRKGDTSTYVFTPAGVQVVANDQPTGTYRNQAFAYLLLSTFIGAEPPSEALKRALLGTHN